MFNRKGFVSLITFSLLILLFVSIFSFSYYYYSTSSKESLKLVEEIDTLNVLISFRADILNLISNDNSTLNYSNNQVSDSFTIYLNNSQILGKSYYQDTFVEQSISNLGVNFCSNYTIYPVIVNSFYFNGSCISKIS